VELSKSNSACKNWQQLFPQFCTYTQ